MEKLQRNTFPNLRNKMIEVLTNIPETRSNKKLLYWEVYRSLGIMTPGEGGHLRISKSSFLRSPSEMTITLVLKTITKEFPTFEGMTFLERKKKEK